MATKRQEALHAGGGGHDGQVADAEYGGPHDPYMHMREDGTVRPKTKGEVQDMHDQAVKDGRTQDARDLHAHLERVHGGGGTHGSY